jgi:hypothetical protein
MKAYRSGVDISYLPVERPGSQDSCTRFLVDSEIEASTLYDLNEQWRRTLSNHLQDSQDSHLESRGIEELLQISHIVSG